MVEDAHQALIRLYTALKNTSADDKPLDWNEKYAAQFKEAMDDDFNTAQAVAVLFELAKEVNQTKSPELARQLKNSEVCSVFCSWIRKPSSKALWIQ